MRSLFKTSMLAATLSFASITHAASMEVSFDIPQVTTGKYARPYVAIWAEQGKESKPLLVWHLQGKEDKWLKDLRRWWRKIGRYDAHVDSLTGATKGPGHYQESLDLGDWSEFTLYIEAARENGGRSLVKTKIDLNSATQYSIPAEAEIGPIQISINP
ncbi:DUF2271 domain-containing protein [Marinomonas communis]|uniref:DUF2271 domain-containing protein n=1 Tax=Marinomonas communis TaxID=28254 RepID=UPI001002E65E|nr:DUF2271 domain-containing protein [Marinomonas communis]MCC4274162.1 DUF2271 domain-containing protein [Marinomonas communis]RUM51479.1 MAG: DUF2271 domain-containing protein [Marinomonas sp.]